MWATRTDDGVSIETLLAKTWIHFIIFVNQFYFFDYIINEAIGIGLRFFKYYLGFDIFQSFFTILDFLISLKKHQIDI